MKKIIRKFNIFLSMSLILMLFGCSNIGAKADSIDKIDEETIDVVENENNAELKDDSDSNVVDHTGNIQLIDTVAEDKELQKFIDANTIDSLMKNYMSIQIYDYGINKNGEKTTYFEGYEDIHNNRAVRIKESTFNNDIDFEKLPYYVKDKNGLYCEVIGDDSSSLSKNHILNKSSNNNIYQLNYGRNSIVYNKGKIVENNIESGIGKMIVEIPVEDIIEDKYMLNYYKSELGIDNIDIMLIEYEYDIKTSAITSAKVAVICDDMKDYVVSNITIDYDVDIITPVKLINDEDGKAVYFDMDILEKANTYSSIKKDTVSIVLNDFIYDKDKNIVKYMYIYKDVDDNIVIKDNNEIYVKYENKWYDILSGTISPSKLSDDKKKRYDDDPIAVVLSNAMIIDTSEKVITAYEGNNEAVVIQENTNLDKNKLYIASTLPCIDNVYKTRKEIRYDMDNDVVKSYTLTSYNNDGNYIVEEFNMSLDENEPPEINDVINYVDNINIE